MTVVNQKVRDTKNRKFKLLPIVRLLLVTKDTKLLVRTKGIKNKVIC